MKKFFHAALVLPLVLFAVSCGESNDDGGDKPVKLSPETKKEQQLYADDEQAPAPIRFTATAPWTATVTELQTKAEAGRVDWLTLSAYEGGAGDVSLTMELKPNLTGQDRKAEIRIVCDGTTIKITVEQSATKKDGTNPDQPTGYALVERIDARFWIGCEEEAGSGEYRDGRVYTFRYDDQNRIAEYEFSDYNYDNGESELDYKYTVRFDYSIQGEIRLTEHVTYDANNTEDEPRTETYRVWLDDQGRATKIKADESIHENNPITYNYSYNDEGRLSRLSWYDPHESSTEIYEALTYQNGVLSKISRHYYYGDDEEVVFPADAFSDRANDRLNIDPNWLIFMDPIEPQEMLPMLRLTGKGCDRLPLWLPIDYEDDDPNFAMPIGWSEPNVTVHKTIDYYVHRKTEPLQYTFNDDGTIASIVQPVVHIKMRHEYDMVVGNEFTEEYPDDYPDEYRLYKYTVANGTTREVERSTDKHEWTFTYRK